MLVMTRHPFKVYVQPLQTTTLFKKITDDMTRFSKEFPLRAYTYPNVLTLFPNALNLCLDELLSSF